MNTPFWISPEKKKNKKYFQYETMSIYDGQRFGYDTSLLVIQNKHIVGSTKYVSFFNFTHLTSICKGNCYHESTINSKQINLRVC